MANDSPLGDLRAGRDAHTVRRRILSSRAGWKKRPTPEEFYNAVRAERPTPRQTGIMRMWGAEATVRDLLDAWVQHAYTLRQLVQALHRAHFDCGSRIRNQPMDEELTLNTTGGRLWELVNAPDQEI